MVRLQLLRRLAGTVPGLVHHGSVADPGNGTCDHHDWPWWHGHGSPWGGWHDGANPGLAVEGASDEVGSHGEGSLGLPVLTTPSAHPAQIDGIHSLDETSEALLHRIVIRGQLTTAEGAALSFWNLAALNTLVTLGYVAKVGSVWMPKNATWLAIGLADAPTITSINNSRPMLASSTVTLTGTGD